MQTTIVALRPFAARLRGGIYGLKAIPSTTLLIEISTLYANVLRGAPPSLPLEIIRLIMIELNNLPRASEHSRHILEPCSLVCSTWTPLEQSRILSSISVEYTTPRDLPSATSTINKHARSISIDIRPKSNASVSQWLPMNAFMANAPSNSVKQGGSEPIDLRQFSCKHAWGLVRIFSGTELTLANLPALVEASFQAQQSRCGPPLDATIPTSVQRLQLNNTENIMFDSTQLLSLLAIDFTMDFRPCDPISLPILTFADTLRSLSIAYIHPPTLSNWSDAFSRLRSLRSLRLSLYCHEDIPFLPLFSQLPPSIIYVSLVFRDWPSMMEFVHDEHRLGPCLVAAVEKKSCPVTLRFVVAHILHDMSTGNFDVLDAVGAREEPVNSCKRAGVELRAREEGEWRPLEFAQKYV